MRNIIKNVIKYIMDYVTRNEDIGYSIFGMK